MANHIKQGNVNAARTLKELAEEVSTLASMAKDVMTDKHGNFFDRYSELKMRHDVNNVLNGKTNSAQVKAAGLKDLPINYTQDVHNRLLSKHPDDMNASFINNLEHLETLRNPDMVYEDTPRDVQYRRMDIMDDDLAGRVSVKPLNSDGASYINTAHVMDGKETTRGVPTLNVKTATAEDYAFSRASNVDANTNISQNDVIVNNRNVLTGKQIKSKREVSRLLMDQFDAVDKPTARATKPNGTFYNIHNEYGLSDGDQIRQAVSYAEPGNLVPQIIREAAGQALNSATNLVDVAATLATGGASKALTTGLTGAATNALQGAVGGFADELEANGEDWSGAGVGAATGAATGLANKLIGKSSSKILDNKLVNSNLGRGAISGGIGGATSAGLSTALDGGNIDDIVGNTVEGAGLGMLQGGVSSFAAGKIQDKVQKFSQNASFKNAIKNPQNITEPISLGKISDAQVAEINKSFDIVDAERAAKGLKPINRSGIYVHNNELIVEPSAIRHMHESRIIGDGYSPRDVLKTMRGATTASAKVLPNEKYPLNATMANRGKNNSVNAVHVTGKDGKVSLKSAYNQTEGNIKESYENTLGGSKPPSTAISGDDSLPARASALQGANDSVSQNPQDVNSSKIDLSYLNEAPVGGKTRTMVDYIPSEKVAKAAADNLGVSFQEVANNREYFDAMNELLQGDENPGFNAKAIQKRIQDAITETSSYAESLSGVSDVIHKKDLPKIKTSDYKRAMNITKLEDADPAIRPFLSEKGRSLDDVAWGELMPQFTGKGVQTHHNITLHNSQTLFRYVLDQNATKAASLLHK